LARQRPLKSLASGSRAAKRSTGAAHLRVDCAPALRVDWHGTTLASNQVMRGVCCGLATADASRRAPVEFSAAEEQWPARPRATSKAMLASLSFEDLEHQPADADRGSPRTEVAPQRLALPGEAVAPACGFSRASPSRRRKAFYRGRIVPRRRSRAGTMSAFGARRLARPRGSTPSKCERTGEAVQRAEGEGGALAA
jgi:hypothetical protein